jgi:hypothetical protein
MKLTGTYVWSVSVEIEVSDTATNDKQREALDNEAMKAELDFKNPILHKCSNEDLID